jgi:preprotein translocase subunit SecD
MLRGLTVGTALFCGAVLTFGVTEAASFELHVVVPCGPQDKAYVLEGTSHEFCLAPDKVIDETGIVKAERYPVISRVIVDVTQAASDKLLAVSSQNVGNDLAVLFNGKLIFKATIDAPLKLDKFQLSLNNAPEQVDALVDAFPGPKT